MGASTSTIAILKVVPVPVITSLSDARQLVKPGQNIDLNVSAIGSGPLSYQWTRNGRPINGATSSYYKRSSVGIQDGGYYLVYVSDSLGTRRSTPIFVTVAPAGGFVVLWGDATHGRTNSFPADLTDVIAVTARGFQALVLKADGTVLPWFPYSPNSTLEIFTPSSFYSPPVPFPMDLSSVVAIASGAKHSLALRADGKVVAWGETLSGQCWVPANLIDVVAIAAGGLHSLALKADGTVVGWGSNNTGQTTIPPGLTNVIAISAAENYSLALLADGTVVTWGTNSSDLAVVPTGLSNVRSIASGRSFSIALKDDGTVVSWGNLSSGSVPPNLTGVIAISAGFTSALALKSDRTALAWNDNVADASNYQATVPTGLTNINFIAVGTFFGLAVCDPIAAITTQPINQLVVEGGTAIFTTAANGNPEPTYQWQKNGVNIAGANSNIYTIAKVAMGDVGNYTVVVSNSAGTATSNSATLAIKILPVIATHPLSQPAFAGSTVNFTGAASSSTALTYQWQKGGINIPGATNPTLALSNIQLTDAGSYALVATDAVGSTTSRFARLVVLVAQPNAISYATTVSSSSVTAGGAVNLAYFMTNVGTQAWGAAHYLSIRDINGTFVGFSSLIGTLPGETTTAILNFPAPATPGAYTYYVQALENGVQFFSTQTTLTLTVLAPLANSITYNTTTFPVSAAPGSNVVFTYNVTNTGSQTWGANHILSLKNSSGTTLSSALLTVLAPGSSKTVNLSFTAPNSPSIYNYTVQASQTGVGDFNTHADLTLVVLAPRPNAIVYTRTRSPDEVVPGATLNLSYSLSNAGTQTWGAGHYVSLRDENGTFLSFLPLNGIATGGKTNVAFSFTAATTPGLHTFYVQAFEDGIEFFATQDVVVIQVDALPLRNAITYNTTTFPATAAPGANVSFTYNITNRGTKTWGATDYLSFRDVDNTFLGFPSISGVAPGANKTVNISFTAPTTPGIYTYKAQGMEDGVAFYAMDDTLVLFVQ